MRNTKAKLLRRLTKFDVKKWRLLSPREKYHIEQRERTEYRKGHPVTIRSFGVYCRNPRAQYQLYKKHYVKNTRI